MVQAYPICLPRHSETLRRYVGGGSESSAGCLIYMVGLPPPEDPETRPDRHRGRFRMTREGVRSRSGA